MAIFTLINKDASFTPLMFSLCPNADLKRWLLYFRSILCSFLGSAESIPSFFLSFSRTSSHDFLGLQDLFCATTFSLRTSAIQPVLRSTCPNHLILLVWSTTSKSWMPSFVRREFELTSSFAWHCRSNGWWHSHCAGDGSVYPPSCPKSLLHAASHSSHMMNTPYLWSEWADGSWWEGEAIGWTSPMHICSVWSQPACSHLLQTACPQGSRTLGQLQAFRFQPQPLKLLFHR